MWGYHVEIVASYFNTLILVLYTSSPIPPPRPHRHWLPATAQVAQGCTTLSPHLTAFSNSLTTPTLQMTVLETLLAVQHMLEYPFPRHNIVSGEVDCFAAQ